jgi:hypothetical protein
MLIIYAQPEDHDAIWRILEPTIRTGATYALPREMNQAEAIAYLTGPDRKTFVGGDLVPLVRFAWTAVMAVCAVPLIAVALVGEIARMRAPMVCGRDRPRRGVSAVAHSRKHCTCKEQLAQIPWN